MKQAIGLTKQATATAKLSQTRTYKNVETDLPSAPESRENPINQDVKEWNSKQ
jgi:hypothetical protein